MDPVTALERSSLDSFEKVSDGVKIVREVEQPYNDQVNVFDQLVGETMLLEQECLRADSLYKQSVPQGLRQDWVTGY